MKDERDAFRQYDDDQTPAVDVPTENKPPQFSKPGDHCNEPVAEKPPITRPSPPVDRPRPVPEEPNETSPAQTNWTVLIMGIAIVILLLILVFRGCTGPTQPVGQIDFTPVTKHLSKIQNQLQTLLSRPIIKPVPIDNSDLREKIKKLEGANRYLRSLEKSHRLTIKNKNRLIQKLRDQLRRKRVKPFNAQQYKIDRVMQQRRYYFQEWLKAAQKNDNKEWILCFSDGPNDRCHEYTGGLSLK